MKAHDFGAPRQPGHKVILDVEIASTENDDAEARRANAARAMIESTVISDALSRWVSGADPVIVADHATGEILGLSADGHGGKVFVKARRVKLEIGGKVFYSHGQ